MAFDVFISYASKDKVVADAICARLESAGIRCWIAPRDIVAGRSYGEAIIEAIHVAKVMVLVFSSNANASGHIPKEVERAVSSGLAILPFRIEDVSPGKSLDYFIGSVHWLDAMSPPMEKHLDNLAATVQKLLPEMAADPSTRAQPPTIWRSAPGIADTAPPTNRPAQAAGNAPHAPSSKNIWIGAAAVAALAVVVATVMIMRSGAGNSPGAAVTPGSTGPIVDNPPLSATNPPVGKTTPTDTNPHRKLDTPDSRTTPPPRSTAVAPTAVQPTSDPIVGCYQWFNNAPVVIRAAHHHRRPLHRTLARNRRRPPFLHLRVARSSRRHHHHLPRSALSQRRQSIRIPNIGHAHLRNQRPARNLALAQWSSNHGFAKRHFRRWTTSRKMAGSRPLARSLHPHLAGPGRHRHPHRFPHLRHEPARHRHFRHPHRRLPLKLAAHATNKKQHGTSSPLTSFLKLARCA